MRFAIGLTFLGCLLFACSEGADTTAAPPGPPPAAGTGAACGGIAGIPCKVPLFCDHEPGCAPDAAGVCVEVKEPCDDAIREPVCGCNGRTYPNDCFRIRDRVSKKHDGPCRDEG